MDIFQQIDQFVYTQYPQWYQTNGPNFIAFVQAYYQWLENEGNALYYSRQYYNIKDIDTTFDAFIVYFKEKYFKNIALGTAADIRFLIKRALDIYRAKGTQVGTSLLFQLAYGVTPQFYYPSTDLFKLSSGTWFQPRYLELSLSDNTVLLNQLEVKGATSGAIAFVDSVIRRFTQTHLQDIAYISAIQGTFITGEAIIPTNGSLPITQCPILKGSLTSINLGDVGSGIDYTPGTIVPITSFNGNNALFLITNTTSESMTNIIFTDGGYGFTNNATLYLSNVNVTLANITISNTEPFFNNAWDFLDTVTQPLASLNYQQANGQLVYGQVITTYFPNNSIMGNGVIIGVNQSNSTAGQITVTVNSGNVGNSFYTTANAIGANLTLANGYTDITATGNYIANNTTLNLILNASNGTFLLNEEVINFNPEREVIWGSGFVDSYNANNGLMSVIMEKGILYPGHPLVGQVSMASANIASVSTTIGLINLNNSFIGSNIAYCSSNLMTANVAVVQPISGSVTVTQSPVLNFSETIQVGTDIIQPYLPLQLNVPHYGFPAAPLGNLTFLSIGQQLNYSNLTIGEVANLFFIGGSLSSVEPFIIFDQSQISNRTIYDDILSFTNATGTFPVGDIIEQGITNARGQIRSNSNNVLYLKRMRFANDFIVTTNSATLLTGLFSGFTANCTNVAYDFDSQVMGRNLQTGLSFSTGNGVIISGQVVDSGFGFINGETLTIGSNGATGSAIVTNYGTGSGYYADIGGVLSGPKRLFDGVFYQNFSYEIISPLLLSKYQQLVEDITHPAGMALFGRFVFSQTSPSTINLAQNTFKTGNQYGLVTQASAHATVPSIIHARSRRINFGVTTKVLVPPRAITKSAILMIVVEKMRQSGALTLARASVHSAVTATAPLANRARAPKPFTANITATSPTIVKQAGKISTFNMQAVLKTIIASSQGVGVSVVGSHVVGS